MEEVGNRMKTLGRKDRKLNNAGMSLVEIIVAMCILTIVTVSVLSILKRILSGSCVNSLTAFMRRSEVWIQ